jgi:hypothetical protein
MAVLTVSTRAQGTLLGRLSHRQGVPACTGDKSESQFSDATLQKRLVKNRGSDKGDVQAHSSEHLKRGNTLMQHLSSVLHAFHDPERRERCSVSALSLNDLVSDWNGERAPFSYQPMRVSAALWPFVLVAFAWGSIALIRSGYTSVAWAMLAYEAYIIFDHLPYLFTNDLYTSAQVNFEHTDLTAFWGMEATSTVISYVAVGAPWWVMGNIPNHLSFIFFNYCICVATSETFQYARKRWFLVVAVACDTSLHCVSAFFYIKYLLGDGVTCSWQTCLLWMALNAAMILLTMWIHYDFMHWEHFLVHFKVFGFGPASKLA